MAPRGEFLEQGLDLFALQRITTQPADTLGAQLYIDGIAWPDGVGGGGSAHTIQDEGVDQTDRSKLNFVGSGVTVTDDAGNDATVVTITDNDTIYAHPNHTGDVTSVGDGATTIANDAVTNAKLANMAQNTVKGRVSAGTGDPEDMTASQLRGILNVADGANNYVHPNHTGDVTSVADGATTLASTAITGKSSATPASGDSILLSDADDSGNLKKATLSSLMPALSTQIRPVATLTDAATVSVDASLAVNGIFKLTATSGVGATRELGAPTGSPVDGQSFELWYKQDSAGSRALTFNAIYLFSADIPSPTLSTAANRTDVLVFKYNSAAVKWMCTSVIVGYAT